MLWFLLLPLACFSTIWIRASSLVLPNLLSSHRSVFFILTRRTFPGHSCWNSKGRKNPELQRKVKGYEAEEEPDFFHDFENAEPKTYSALFFMLWATMVKKALSSSLMDAGTFVSSMAASMSSSQRSASAFPMGNGACLILSLGCPRLA